jgi:hypothetical protein
MVNTFYTYYKNHPEELLADALSTLIEDTKLLMIDTYS